MTTARHTGFEDAEIRRLLEGIYARYHHDFRCYSLPSLRRRLSAALGHLRCESLAELEERVLQRSEIFSQLLAYLTVQVSDMFRDPAFFLAMREHIVPILRTYPSLKLWVAGCSSGEEVYSFAIVLKEEGLLDRTILYATDIQPEALRRAAAGIYAIDRVAAFTLNHRASGAKVSLSEHYAAAYGAIVMDRELRNKIVFSDHSLVTDSVFAEVQLVSCRNVLIYFDSSLRGRVLALFGDSLCRRGFLGLGSRETLPFSERAAGYRQLVSDQPWYQRW